MISILSAFQTRETIIHCAPSEVEVIMSFIEAGEDLVTVFEALRHPVWGVKQSDCSRRYSLVIYEKRFIHGVETGLLI